MLLLSVSCNLESTSTPEPATPTTTPIIFATVTPNGTEVAPDETGAAEEVAQESIIVGSKQDIEQSLLGKILVLALEKAGFEVEDRTGEAGYADTLALREALEAGEMDLQWESTGTALSVIHNFNMDDLQNDPNSFLRTVRSLDQARGLQWLDRLEYNNTHTLVVSKDLAIKEGINTLQELANFMNQKDSALKLCASEHFQENQLPALQEQYGFTFKEENIQIVEHDQAYQSLRDGQCDVTSGHSTDGYVTAWGFQSLEDTRRIFSFDNPAPVIRQAILEQRPEVATELANLLSDINPRLDKTRMSLLNACVELGADGEANSGDEMSVEEVARAFLEKERLDCLPRPIIVGSRLANRSVWVGKGFVLILKDRGYDVVDKTAFGLRPVIREAMLNGEIDLYCERTTQVLTELHNIEPQALSDEPEALYTLAKNLDEPLGLTWIVHSKNQIFPTLVVEPTLYEEEGIQSIAELADFMNSNDKNLNLCVKEGFYKAPDGMLALEEYYGFKFKDEQIVWTNSQKLDRYPNYEAMRDGECDITHGSSADNLEPWGFTVLTDTKSFFPPSVSGVVVRQDLLEEYPELADSIACVTDYLDAESLAALNRATRGADGESNTIDDVSMETVALPFFCEQGLVKNNCPVVAKVEEKQEAPEEGPEGQEVDGEPSPTAEPTATPKGQVCRELVLNGDFERDEAWELPATSGYSQYSTEVPHSGRRAMQLGSLVNDDDISHSLTKQLVQIPSDVESATFSYWYYPVSQNPSEGEEQGALIYSRDESFVWRKLQEGASDEEVWIKQEHDLSALIGEEVYLYFYLNGNGDGWTSAMYLDDVSLQLCSGAQPSAPAATSADDSADDSADAAAGESKETIVIASDELTENLLGGKMLLLLLQSAGYKVEDKTALGDTLAVREALINGEIDLHWEVTGSALTLFHDLPLDTLPTEPARSYELIRKLDEQKNDLVWVDKANVNTSYVLMVQPSTYEQGIGTLEELADFMNENDAPLNLCVDEGFYAQPAGLSGLQEHYGFQFKEENILVGEFDESYQGLREGSCEVAVGLNTDGRISAWEFQTLEDSLNFFPAYTWGLVTRPDILEAFPKLEGVLRQITSGVTHEAVRQPNVRLKLGPDLEPGTGDEESVDDVARLFLCEAGMIDQECP